MASDLQTNKAEEKHMVNQLQIRSIWIHKDGLVSAPD